MESYLVCILWCIKNLKGFNSNTGFGFFQEMLGLEVSTVPQKLLGLGYVFRVPGLRPV